MRFARVIAAGLFLLGLACLSPSNGQFLQIIGAGSTGGGGGGGCAQYTALAARMDGGQNASAVQTAVCTAVSNGDFAHLDFWYVGAVNSVGNSLLNWVQNSFNLTSNGTITFAANQGWTGDGTTGFYSTGFTPSTAGGHYAQNNAAISSCQVNSRTTGNTAVSIGGQDVSGNAIFIEPLFTGSTTLRAGINQVGGGGTVAAANSQGALTVVRTSSASWTIYRNGSSIGSTSDTSSALPAFNVTLLAYNNNSSFANGSTDQIAYIWGGDGSVSPLNMYNVMHTYLQAVGETTAC